MENVIDSIMGLNIRNDGTVNLGTAISLSDTDFDTADSGTMYCWDWWRTYYYPVYYESFRYEDKGKKAIEIVKIFMDTKVIKVSTVKQFVDLLDKILKIL